MDDTAGYQAGRACGQPAGNLADALLSRNVGWQQRMVFYSSDLTHQTVHKVSTFPLPAGTSFAT